MPDRDEIDATVRQFHSAVLASAEAMPDPVTEASRRCGELLAEWEGAGRRLPDAGPVLASADALLVELYEAYPEGLPLTVRAAATEALTLLDEAAEQGFDLDRTAPSP